MTLLCKNCGNEITNPRSKVFCSNECYKKYGTANYKRKNGKQFENIIITPEAKLPEIETDFDKLTIGEVKIKYVEMRIENLKIKDEKKKLEDKLLAIGEILSHNNSDKKFYGALTEPDIKKYVHPDQQPQKAAVSHPVVYEFVKQDGSKEGPKTMPKDELMKRLDPVGAKNVDERTKE